MAPGLGAPGLGAGAPGRAGRRPEPPPALNASCSFRTTGASIVEDAERTNSPSSWSLAMTTLLSTPSSLASSYTRTLATSLLMRSGVGRPPDLRYFSGVLIAYSSSAHRNLDLLPTREVPAARPVRAALVTCYVSRRGRSCGASGAAVTTALRRFPVSSGPWTFSARGNARRRTASSRQSGVGCRYAPRPGSVPRRSGTQRSPCATTRSRSFLAERRRHPTQVRSGQARVRVRPDTSDSTSPSARPRRGAGWRWSLQRAGGRPYSGSAGTSPGGPHASLAERSGRACCSAVSGRMSMRQPVRRAASRAFCPSLPMARESW